MGKEADSDWMEFDTGESYLSPEKLFDEEIQAEIVELWKKIDQIERTGVRHFSPLSTVTFCADPEKATHPETAYVRGVAVNEVFGQLGILKDYYEAGDSGSVFTGTDEEPHWELLIARPNSEGVFKVVYSTVKAAEGITRQTVSYKAKEPAWVKKTNPSQTAAKPSTTSIDKLIPPGIQNFAMALGGAALDALRSLVHDTR